MSRELDDRHAAAEIRRRERLSLGRRFALHDRRKLCDFLPHDLAGLEFNRGPSRNDKAASRLIRVAAHTWLGEFDFEDAEVSQFDRISLRESVGDVVERPLDNIENLVLDQAGFVADFNDEFPFR